VPKITDFGLAKQLGEEGPTQTEAIMGTPAYMAPEQIIGKARDIGPAADQYALGAILYELLTGQPPFKGETKMDTLEMARTQEPVPPSRLQPKVPRDLDTICLKCLRKEAAKRYATAQDLADDLHRFLAGRPIVARPVSALERAWKWAKRRPAVAGLLAALVLVFVVGFVGVTWSYLEAEAARRDEARQRQAADQARKVAEEHRQQAEEHRQQAEAAQLQEAEQRRTAVQARDEAKAALEKAETNIYYSRIAQARLEWRANNAAAATLLLDGCQEDRRGWEWYHLSHLFHADLLTTRPLHRSWAWCVAFSPDGRSFASAGGGNPFYGTQKNAVWGGEVIVWDARTGQPLSVLRGHQHLVTAVAYSGDGRRLASASHDGTVKVWDAATGRELLSLPSPAGTPGWVAFRPDGQVLAAGQDNGLAHVWDVNTGQLLHTLDGHGGPVRCLAFRPDGQQLATAGEQGTVTVWDSRTGQEHLASGGPEGRALGLAFSPDGRRLAAGYADGTARVWDGPGGSVLCTLRGHSNGVNAVAFSPDGRYVATGGGDHMVRVWDARGGGERLAWRGHTGPVLSVAFDPSGRRLASTGHDGTVKVWDVTAGPEAFSLPAQAGGDLAALAFDPSGRFAISVRQGGGVEVRDTLGGWLRHSLHVELIHRWLVPATTAAFSGDRRLLATVTGATPPWVKVWDVADGREVLALPTRCGNVWHVALSRDGRRVAAEGWGSTATGVVRRIQVWDRPTGLRLAEFLYPGRPTLVRPGALALSPDNRSLACDEYVLDESAAGGPRVVVQVKVRDVTSGQERLRLRGAEESLEALTYSPDGRQLAASDRAGSVFAWDAGTGRRLLALRNAEPLEDLAFSPDGRRLAGVSRNQVWLWDAATGQEVLTLRGAPQRPSDNGFNPRVAFSPDGRKLAALNWDQTISVWEAPESPEASRWVRRQGAEDRAFGWHLNQARAALAAKQAGAVVFHLKCLQDLKPPSVVECQAAEQLRRDVAVLLTYF
jgi:WD40 repeat protein